VGMCVDVEWRSGKMIGYVSQPWKVHEKNYLDHDLVVDVK